MKYLMDYLLFGLDLPYADCKEIKFNSARYARTVNEFRSMILLQTKTAYSGLIIQKESFKEVFKPYSENSKGIIVGLADGFPFKIILVNDYIVTISQMKDVVDMKIACRKCGVHLTKLARFISGTTNHSKRCQKKLLEISDVINRAFIMMLLGYNDF